MIFPKKRFSDVVFEFTLSCAKRRIPVENSFDYIFLGLNIDKCINFHTLCGARRLLEADS